MGEKSSFLGPGNGKIHLAGEFQASKMTKKNQKRKKNQKNLKKVEKLEKEKKNPIFFCFVWFFFLKCFELGKKALLTWGCNTSKIVPKSSKKAEKNQQKTTRKSKKKKRNTRNKKEKKNPHTEDKKIIKKPQFR